MGKLQFNNGEKITAGHLGYAIKVIIGMAGVLISLIVYIYIDYQVRQGERDQIQDARMDQLYDELILTTCKNSAAIEIIKEQVEKNTGTSLDKDINERFRLRNSNARGGSSFVPEENEDLFVKLK